MAQDDWKKQAVAQQTHDIVRNVATATGVAPDMVEKVLGHLGLENALLHKLELPHGVRIAAGQERI